MEDQRNILFEEKPFSCKVVAKEKKAIVKYKGKDVAVISGKDFNKLERVIALDNIYELQLFLAKVTGHFKHSTEN
jgi:hypothetical protein